MSRRVYVDPNRANVKPREFSQNSDSGLQYKVDFSGLATKRGTTVSGVTWDTVGTAQLSFSNEALASGVATAYASGSQYGKGIAKVTAAFTDGTPSVVQYLHIFIEDPDNRV